MRCSLFAPAADWPVLGEYDVVVVGAGPGGIGAGVAAARQGARTLVLEKAGCPGGMATRANCPHIMGLSLDGRQIVAGLADEFVRRLDRLGYGRMQYKSRDPEAEPIGDRPLEYDVIATVHGIQLVAYRMLEEAGADRLFQTTLIGAVAEGRGITAIAVDHPDGVGLVRGRIFIDASGDAALVHRAGGAVRVAPDDVAMTKTLLFDVGGVAGFDHSQARERFQALSAAGQVPIDIQTSFMGFKSLEPGFVHLNYTAATGDALSGGALARLDMELREQIETGVAWYRKNMPGFAECYLARSAMAVGVRAGRAAVGLETITQEDIDTNAPVAEPIAVGIRRYGDHGTRRFEAAWRKPVGGTRPIPWKTLLSADFDNVALAGRCISSDPKMITCFRYIAQCLAMGQAAGTNAALALAGGTTLRGLGYEKLRSALLADGALLA